MPSIDEFLTQWRGYREGFIKEVERIPEDKLSFRASPEMRSVLEVIHHAIESERMLVDEICRDDTNLKRLFTRSPDAEVIGATTKEAVINLMRSSLAASSEKVRQFGQDKLEQLVTNLEGRQVTRLSLLNFTSGHEMYHRGQLTVYQRLLGIEPALTEQFRLMLSKNQ